MIEEQIKELKKLGKPIVHCEDYKIIEYEEYGTLFNRILFENKKNKVKSYNYTMIVVEKDGILITDDFIFIKE